MTFDQLWAPDEILGKPIRVGHWLYDGRIPLGVRLFKAAVVPGTGDDSDEPEDRDDQAIECYYLQFQAAGDNHWNAQRVFRSLQAVDQYAEVELGGAVEWRVAG